MKCEKLLHNVQLTFCGIPVAITFAFLIQHGYTTVANFHYAVAVEHDIHLMSVINCVCIFVVEANIENIAGSRIHPAKASLDDSLKIDGSNELVIPILAGTNVEAMDVRGLNSKRLA